MPEKLFTYKNVRYHLYAYGVQDNYYGQAEREDAGSIYARIDKPCKTIEQAFERLKSLIKEKIDAHRYDVGGEHLIGTVRACAKLVEKQNERPIAIQVYIGRLGFTNKSGKQGVTIGYVEGTTESEAYDKLDEEARKFGAKDGFQTIRRN